MLIMPTYTFSEERLEKDLLEFNEGLFHFYVADTVKRIKGKGFTLPPGGGALDRDLVERKGFTQPIAINLMPVAEIGLYAPDHATIEGLETALRLALGDKYREITDDPLDTLVCRIKRINSQTIERGYSPEEKIFPDNTLALVGIASLTRYLI